MLNQSPIFMHCVSMNCIVTFVFALTSPHLYAQETEVKILTHKQFTQKDGRVMHLSHNGDFSTIELELSPKLAAKSTKTKTTSSKEPTSNHKKRERITLPDDVLKALVQMREEDELRGLSLDDINLDGFADLDALGHLGTVNSAHQIFLWDPKSNSFYPFFSGGYLSLEWHRDLKKNNYLIESGRASCCSWEYHAYRVKKNGDRLSVPEIPNFIIGVQAEAQVPEIKADNEFATCRFSREIALASGSSYRTILPPDSTWLKYCYQYELPVYLQRPHSAYLRLPKI